MELVLHSLSAAFSTSIAYFSFILSGLRVVCYNHIELSLLPTETYFSSREIVCLRSCPVPFAAL